VGAADARRRQRLRPAEPAALWRRLAASALDAALSMGLARGVWRLAGVAPPTPEPSAEWYPREGAEEKTWREVLVEVGEVVRDSGRREAADRGDRIRGALAYAGFAAEVSALVITQGRSPGRWAFGTRVARMGGGRLGLGRVAFRQVTANGPLAFFRPLLPNGDRLARCLVDGSGSLFDCLCAAWRSDGRTLHDLAVGTWVVRGR